MVFALGTAQLGLHYGINNGRGPLSDREAYEILDAALDLGFVAVDVDTLHYGEANRRVKDYLECYPGAFKVLVRGAMNYVSTYDPKFASEVAGYEHVRFVQVPSNALDGRMDDAIWKLKMSGKTVIVRSLFLQGLLAVDPKLGPAGIQGTIFERARGVLLELAKLASEYELTVPELAARWSLLLIPDILLVGAERPEQLTQLVRWISKGPLNEALVAEVLILRSSIDRSIITPTEWGQEYAFAPGSA